MMKYHLVPMNFLECDFERMRKEWKEHKKIMWQVPGAPVYDKKTKSWNIKSGAVMPNMIKTGDIIYFYVFNIPSNGGADKSRILLRGIVNEEPTPVKYRDVYFSDEVDGEKMIIGFSINNVTTLEKSELENDTYYCRESLKSKYKFSAFPQGKNWPNSYDKNLNSDLIKDLENSFKKRESERDFEVLIKHFDRECFFSWKKLGTKNDHKTFKRRNGTDYYETHHFIPYHLSKNNTELASIIDDQRNLICLCSNCHNKLHYGRPNEINHMIDLLWEDDEIKNMLKTKDFLSIIGVDDDKAALDWIKSVYRSSENKKKNWE